MILPSDPSSEDRLRARMAAFDADFQQRVLEYRKAPDRALLARIVEDVIAHHAGAETLATGRAEKGEAVLLIEDLGFDSLALVDLSFQAEEFVDVLIQIEDFAAIKTLADLQAFMQRKAFPPAAESHS